MIDRRNFLAALLSSTAIPTLKLHAATSTGGSQSLADDPRRPQFHFLPAANWMNDPNGPIYWNGNYHMFYQYNPNGAFWGDMHWGHGVSSDMLHWHHLPVALAPTPTGPDADGCYTGTAVVEDGQVLMMYTGVRACSADQATIKDSHPPLRETQCLAVANDPDLRTFSKVDDPVIPSPPSHFQVNGFRDPSPWKQGDWWYAVVASGIANQGGAIFLYRSKDLHSWEFLHIFAQRDRSGLARFDSYDPWEVWECPEFFALGDWHVLIYSTAGKTYWQSGKLDAESMTFHPAQAGLMDYGSLYACKTQLDKTGNRILWGWVTEARPVEEYKAAGWAGILSLPRELSTTGDGRLLFQVSAEAKQLRGREHSLRVTADQGKMERQINSMRIEGCCGEILCTVQRVAEPFELSVSDCSEGTDPWLTLKYDPLYPEQICVDARPIPLILNKDENLELHLFADGSVLECFVNRLVACTKRFYYPGGRSRDLRIRCIGNLSCIESLSVWQLTPISTNRLAV